MSSVERAACPSCCTHVICTLVFVVLETPRCLLCAVCWGQTGTGVSGVPPCGGASLTPPGVCWCLLPCRSGLYSHAPTTFLLSLRLSVCQPVSLRVCMYDCRPCSGPFFCCKAPCWLGVLLLRARFVSSCLLPVSHCITLPCVLLTCSFGYLLWGCTFAFRRMMRVVCPAVAVLAAPPSVSVRCYCTKVDDGGLTHKTAKQLVAATHACCCNWLLTPRLMVFNSSGGHLLGSRGSSGIYVDVVLVRVRCLVLRVPCWVCVCDTLIDCCIRAKVGFSYHSEAPRLCAIAVDSVWLGKATLSLRCVRGMCAWVGYLQYHFCHMQAFAGCPSATPRHSMAQHMLRVEVRAGCCWAMLLQRLLVVCNSVYVYDLCTTCRFLVSAEKLGLCGHCFLVYKWCSSSR